jgi:Rieske Fe-S protein
LLKEKQIGINDLKVGESVFATYIKDGAPVSLVVARQDASAVVGFKTICTHLGGSLEFSEGSLLCLRHLARFNKLTGYVDAGPAIFPLRTEDIQIINSQPFVLL